MDDKVLIENLLKRKGLPEFKELVVVRITEFTPYGVFCELLEYEDVRGYIPITEVSRKRIKQITEVLRIGMITVGQVIDVKDKDVDISLRRVDESLKKKKINEYKLEKRIATLIYLANKELSNPLDFSQIKFLVNYLLDKYGSLYMFLESYRNSEVL